MRRTSIKRGEVWQINLDPTIGSEINKSRPVVIVNRNSIGRLPLKIIVPLTKWSDSYNNAGWHVPISRSSAKGIKKKSSADTFQVRSLSEERFIERLGVLPQNDVERIDRGLKLSMKLDV